MTLAIILLNWNDEDHVISRALELQSWERAKPRIIIVDNQSVDGSAQKLRTALRNCTILTSPINLGFGGGNNLGLKFALAEGFEHVLLLNGDAQLGEDAMLALLDVMHRHREVSIVSPTIREIRNGLAYDLIGGRNIAFHPATKAVVRSAATSKEAARLSRVHHVSGTVFLLRSTALDETGLLDEDYFFSGEIADFCHRAGKLGLASFVDREVIATHDLLHAGAELRDGLYTYYSLRNRFLFARKHYRLFGWPLAAYWSMLGGFELMKSWMRGRADRTRALRLGLEHGLRGVYGNQNALLMLEAPRNSACKAEPN